MQCVFVLGRLLRSILVGGRYLYLLKPLEHQHRELRLYLSLILWFLNLLEGHGRVSLVVPAQRDEFGIEVETPEPLCEFLALLLMRHLFNF